MLKYEIDFAIRYAYLKWKKGEKASEKEMRVAKKYLPSTEQTLLAMCAEDNESPLLPALQEIEKFRKDIEEQLRKR